MRTVPQHDQEACLRDVVGTVSYFMAVGQWPTVTDVWTWMYQPTQDWSMLDVRQTISALVERGDLILEQGRVRAKGTASMQEAAHDQYLDADKKFRRIRRLAYWVGMIPGVRAFCVCNTLAWEATNPDGDTDVFVIARAGTLWWVRLMCVLPLMLLRARPGQRKRHTVDFTFFVADNALALEDLKYQEEDPYLAYWTCSLIPLIDDGVMDAFWEANVWAAEALPNAAPVKLAWYRRLPDKLHWLVVGISRVKYHALRVTGMMAICNALAKRVSMWRFPQQIREQMNLSSNVIVKDDRLKFHVTDRRAQVLEKMRSVQRQFQAGVHKRLND